MSNMHPIELIDGKVMGVSCNRGHEECVVAMEIIVKDGRVVTLLVDDGGMKIVRVG